MPAKPKAADATPTPPPVPDPAPPTDPAQPAVTDPPTDPEKPAAPSHLAELCGECGQHPVEPGTTSFSCAHGSWDFADFA